MNKEAMKTQELFDITHSITANLLEKHEYPWDALSHIADMIRMIGPSLPEMNYRHMGKDIWIHKSVHMPPTATIAGPLIICQETTVRPGAFLRGNVVIGAGCVIGNSTEIKNSILFDRVQVPHYNYIGDSILGYKSHMGAGSLTSNVKSDKTLVKVHAEDGDIETGLKKFGAMIGDHVEVGCGSVLNPGCVIGKRTNIYPLCSVRGTVNANSIYKGEGNIVEKRRDTES